jgi:hypothetical protein
MAIFFLANPNSFNGTLGDSAPDYTLKSAVAPSNPRP